MNAAKRRAVILLAEDNLGDQERARRAFEDGRIANDLYVVENGEEVMDYLLHRGKFKDLATSPSPDLLLLDLDMPRMDGWQVLKAMKEDPSCPKVTTIILTTSHSEEEVLRGYELGAKSYVTKPIELNPFLQAIKVLQEYWLEIVVLPSRPE